MVRKISAVVVAILFAIATVLALIAYPLGRSLFNPEFYKRALREQQVYERLPGLAAGQLATSLADHPCKQDPDSPDCQKEGRPPVSLLILDYQAWETIFEGLIPPAWLQTQVESAIDQAFAILLDPDIPAETPVTINLEEIKTGLSGEEGLRALQGVLQAQPPCSLKHLQALLELSLSMPSDGSSIVCRPPEAIASKLTPVFETLLDGAAGWLPDEARFTLPGLAGEQSSSAGAAGTASASARDPRQSLRLIRQGIAISPLVPILLLAGLTWLAVRSVRDWLVWWGVPLLAAGLAALLAALVLAPILNLAISQVLGGLPRLSSGLPAVLIQVGLGVAGELTRSLARAIAIPAGITALVGGGMLVGSYFVKGESRV